MVQRLVQTGRACPRNLRTVVYGGGPMYVENLKKATAAFGPIFTQLYGQGEAPMTITGLRCADDLGADDAILGSVGYARSGVDVAVLRDDGMPADTGEIGEIVCRGDIVMSGYWNNPGATRDTLKDGWLFTGDMGSFDARGYLTLRDRSKDVVISGGSNIYPREVEEALLEHPGVSEAGVVGAPDPEWGEVVVAFIVGTADPADLDVHLLLADRPLQTAEALRVRRLVAEEQLRQGAQTRTARPVGLTLTHMLISRQIGIATRRLPKVPARRIVRMMWRSRFRRRAASHR